MTKSMTFRRSLFLLLASLVLALPAFAEPVELHTGQVLVGDVVLQGGNTLLVHVPYPE